MMLNAFSIVHCNIKIGNAKINTVINAYLIGWGYICIA